MKTAKEALASHLGWDMADLKDYNYQTGRYTRAVYALSENYWCVNKDGKPSQPLSKQTDPFEWVEVESYVNKYGYRIFKSPIQ